MNGSIQRRLSVAMNWSVARIANLDARERYDVPVIEVVHPAVRRAVAASRTGRVGVIGTQATITDANVVLGRMPDAFPLGGDLRLNREMAEKVLEPLGTALGMSTIRVARGIIDVAVNNMAQAVAEAEH